MNSSPIRSALLLEQSFAAKQCEGTCGPGHVGGAGETLLLQQSLCGAITQYQLSKVQGLHVTTVFHSLGCFTHCFRFSFAKHREDGELAIDICLFQRKFAEPKPVGTLLHWLLQRRSIKPSKGLATMKLHSHQFHVFVPACQVKVVRFYISECLPPPPPDLLPLLLLLLVGLNRNLSTTS